MVWFFVGLAAGLLIGAIVFFFLGIRYRKNVAEKEIGSAEQEATRIINEAIKGGESKKREMLLEAKEEIHKTRTENEREIKERRTELNKQERRLQQKEESLDKKLDNFERKEEDLRKKQQAVSATQEEVNLVKKSQLAQSCGHKELHFTEGIHSLCVFRKEFPLGREHCNAEKPYDTAVNMTAEGIICAPFRVGFPEKGIVRHEQHLSLGTASKEGFQIIGGNAVKTAVAAVFLIHAVIFKETVYFQLPALYTHRCMMIFQQYSLRPCKHSLQPGLHFRGNALLVIAVNSVYGSDLTELPESLFDAFQIGDIP